VTLFENDVYRLRLSGGGRRVDLGSRVSLSLLAALDTTDGIDETLEILEPEACGDTIVVERRSTLWERAWVELRCLASCIEVHTCVSGRGALTGTRLLGGRSAIPGAHLGRIHSGASLKTLFSPNPEDGVSPLRPVAEGAAIGVVGGGEPGRARWIFTPAPLYFALDGLDLTVAAPVQELRFPEVAFEAVAGGFSLAFDYEGHTHVDGEFRAPAVILTPNVLDPYAGLRRHRDDLAVRGLAPAAEKREQAPWWSEPIFCGWGAQCHLAGVRSGGAGDYATQLHYDAFHERLEGNGLVPGTIAIDDKWQATYGHNEPDSAKWPDLAGWIAERHARELKASIGVPSLYYASHLDATGEELDEDDYAAVRRFWAAAKVRV
jgi:hypothetical protein